MHLLPYPSKHHIFTIDLFIILISFSLFHFSSKQFINLFLSFPFILLNVSMHLMYLWKDISKTRKKKIIVDSFNHSKQWIPLNINIFVMRWEWMPYWLIVFNNVTMKTPLTLHHVMHNPHLQCDFPLHLKHLNELHYLRLKQRWCPQHYNISHITV